MESMTCAHFDEVAPELALEILGGKDRAAAIAHLQTCSDCQDLLSAMISTTDRLLLLSPRAEPPAGFERRIVASVVPVSTVPRRRRSATRVLAALAACILAIVLVIGHQEHPSFATADMRTANGHVVGRVVLESRRPALLVVSLPGWTDQLSRYASPGSAYALRIDHRHERSELLPIDISDSSTWSATVDIEPSSIVSVAIVDSDGHVWCEASL